MPKLLNFFFAILCGFQNIKTPNFEQKKLNKMSNQPRARGPSENPPERKT
jgi:dynein heavy chain